MVPSGIFRKPVLITRIVLCIILFFSTVPAFAQVVDSASPIIFKTVVASEKYEKGSFHTWLWGRHYREDWATPVQVKIINLDTVNGGLVAYQEGGGRQTRSLRLRNPAGKEYVLRSIDKSYGKALPEIYRGTFVENVLNDQVSTAQPYSAVTIPGMASAAGIFHTNPQIVFVPAQKALGEFNSKFGDALYLLEQRPDENWEEAPNFGNAKKIIGTEKLKEHLFNNNEHRVDQLAFVRARLFDMFIGDWSRHDDQWRWARFDDGDDAIYKPVPRDRDQAYTKFDGLLVSVGSSAAGKGHLESFNGNISDVPAYNYSARHIDRLLANEPAREQWIRISKELQQSLTDSVIESSVRELPPEVFAISGNSIIKKLKSRRDHLVEFATEYYEFLAEGVDIVGSQKSEYFSISFLSATETEIRVYDLNKENKPKNDPFYSRKFISKETEEVRIYGIGGNDQYVISGPGGNNMDIRIIGGPGNDTYSGGAANTNIYLYDNRENDLSGLSQVKRKLSDNPFIHFYDYNAFSYDKKGIGPVLSYSSNDRIHVGIKYGIEKQGWRKYPFGQRHEIAARFSINQVALGFSYNGTFTKLVGKWDLRLQGEYDLMRWNNYYGIGNETREIVKNNNDYNRVRSKQVYGGVGVERRFAGNHLVNVTAFYETVRILDDPGRFLAEETPKFQDFETNQFGGARIGYEYQRLDDVVVPMRGIKFIAGIQYTQNLAARDSNVTNFSSALNIYLPVSSSFVFAIKTGAATLSGSPAFYQLNKLGGGRTLRGFRKYRFHGETMFYTQTELQYVPEIRTGLFNGRAGIIGFFDSGRVWQPGESSDTWHLGYGGGIMIAPFNKLSVALFYGLARDENAFSVRFLKGL